MNVVPPAHNFEPVIFFSEPEPVAGKKRSSSTEHPRRVAPLEPVIWGGLESSPPPRPLSGRTINSSQIVDFKFKRGRALALLETKSPRSTQEILKILKADFPKLDEATTVNILQSLLNKNNISQSGTQWSFVKFDDISLSRKANAVWNVIQTKEKPMTIVELQKEIKILTRGEVTSGIYDLFNKQLVSFTNVVDKKGRICKRTWLPVRPKVETETPPLPTFPDSDLFQLGRGLPFNPLFENPLFSPPEELPQFDLGDVSFGPVDL